MNRLLTVFLVAWVNIGLGFAQESPALSKEKTQMCVSKEGKVFSCVFNRGMCYQVEPQAPGTGAASGLSEKGEASLKPCQDTPLQLTETQTQTLKNTQTEWNAKLKTCKKTQQQLASALPVTDTEQGLWDLVECLHQEADVEYQPAKEKELNQKILSLLSLLAQYPKSRDKAYLELGMLYETYFEDYEGAYRAYTRVSTEAFPGVLISLAKAACQQTYPQKSKAGMTHYLEAIEKKLMDVDLNNRAGEKIQLKTLLESCGYHGLTVAVEQQKDLLNQDNGRDPAKTLQFVRKSL
jgi:hypothetical protein